MARSMVNHNKVRDLVDEVRTGNAQLTKAVETAGWGGLLLPVQGNVTHKKLLPP